MHMYLVGDAVAYQQVNPSRFATEMYLEAGCI